MLEWIQSSSTIGLAVSLLAYGVGVLLHRKTRFALCNPLLVAEALVIAFLLTFRLDYAQYESSAGFLGYLLTPTTVCLAIPLYRQLGLLKKHLSAVLLSVLSGVLTSLVSVCVLSHLFGLAHAEYVTLLPKSITAAIGIVISDELGGYATITIASIIITGISGNVVAEGLCRLLRIRSPIARGLAIGTSAHAMGTARAMEMGEIEGAMSSLSLVAAGLVTVVLAPFFAMLP